MYILFNLVTSVVLASDLIQDQSALTVHSLITINDTSRSIYNHLIAARKNVDERAVISRELRLYKYFPHSLTPSIDETKAYHIDESSNEMIRTNQYIIFTTIPLIISKPLTCVIVGVNKCQSEDVAFKSMLYDLNLSIIKPQLKDSILSTY